MPEPPPSPEGEPRAGPRIYVASLSDYNAGRLHGVWVEAAQAPDDVSAAVEQMLQQSPEAGAEEWAIHDYEGFGAVRLGEWESLDYVSRLARGIEVHGLAYAAWASHVGSDVAGLDGFEDAYLGCWQSLEEYAEQMLDDLGATAALWDLPEWLQGYLRLDIAGFARDLALGGDVWAEPGPEGIYVFDGRT